MSRYKRRFPWLAVFSIAFMSAGGYFITACTPPEDGSDGQTDGSGSDVNTNGSSDSDGSDTNTNGEATACKQTDDDGNEFETEVTTTSVEGKVLTYNRKVISTPDVDDSLRIETEVMSDGELVMRVITNVDGMGQVSVDVEYGPAVPGLQNAQILVENGMINGKIDGRDINEMPLDGADSGDTTFADGDGPTDDDISTDLQNALNDLFAKARASEENCKADPIDPDPVDADTNGVGSNGIPQAKILGIPPQDSGHDSDPEASTGCIACWVGCSTGAAGCIAGVSGGCAAALVFYAVCEAIGVGACGVAYLVCVGACNATGAPCCPVSCGSVACCATEESCLNSQIGLCCSVGKKTCLGQNCCESTETCIDSGPNAGICCEPSDVCGNTCCDPTDSCIPAVSLCCPEGEDMCDDKCCPVGQECLGDGVCCDPQDSCGSTCCDELDTCNESTETCCGFDQAFCNGDCCNVGDVCVNSITCCPQARACGDVCCPMGTGCDQQTLQCDACPNATDTACNVGGCCPAGKFCQDVVGECCDQGELFCNGACRPLGECIS